eukprot:TRINITY_DN51231_c0_g1_i1.p1 TRINITY_DN51231_c0_g1~~TRINITY_DN51231_c0_g1_i1.p1  ORF type:complete len:1658 (-),score=308.69 TRINITY_DN51231_c0_g1_i1:45-5018(-)
MRQMAQHSMWSLLLLRVLAVAFCAVVAAIDLLHGARVDTGLPPLGRVYDLVAPADPLCDRHLVDFDCPTHVLRGTVCVPLHGWRVGECTISFAKESTLLGFGSSVAHVGMVHVMSQRTLTLRGSVTVRCHNCTSFQLDGLSLSGEPPCTRGVFAPNARVVLKGELIFTNLSACEAPDDEAEEDMDLSHAFVGTSSGGAILARQLMVPKGSKVHFSGVGAASGSGGAVAAAEVLIEGEAYFGRTEVFAQLNGGAIWVGPTAKLEGHDNLIDEADPLDEDAEPELLWEYNNEVWNRRFEWRLREVPLAVFGVQCGRMCYIGGGDTIMVVQHDHLQTYNLHNGGRGGWAYFHLPGVPEDIYIEKAEVSPSRKEIAVVDSRGQLSIIWLPEWERDGQRMSSWAHGRRLADIEGRASHLAFRSDGRAVAVAARWKVTSHEVPRVVNGFQQPLAGIQLPTQWDTPPSWAARYMSEKLRREVRLFPAAPNQDEIMMEYGLVTAISWGSGFTFENLVVVSAGRAAIYVPLEDEEWPGDDGWDLNSQWHALQMPTSPLWDDVETRVEELKRKANEMRVERVAWKPDGKIIAAWTGALGNLRLLAINGSLPLGVSLEVLWNYRASGNDVLAWSGDGLYLAFDAFAINRLDVWTHDKIVIAKLIVKDDEDSDSEDDEASSFQLSDIKAQEIHLEDGAGDVIYMSFTSYSLLLVATADGSVFVLDLVASGRHSRPSFLPEVVQGSLLIRGHADFMLTHARRQGGAIYVEGSQLEIQNASFLRAYALVSGGALQADVQRIVLEDVNFGELTGCSTGPSVAVLLHSGEIIMRNLVLKLPGATITVQDNRRMHALGDRGKDFGLFNVSCNLGTELRLHKPMVEEHLIVLDCGLCQRGYAFSPNIGPRHDSAGGLLIDLNKGHCRPCAAGLNCASPGADLRGSHSVLLAHHVELQEKMWGHCFLGYGQHASPHYFWDLRNMSAPRCVQGVCPANEELKRAGRRAAGCESCLPGWTSERGGKCRERRVRFTATPIIKVLAHRYAQLQLEVSAPGTVRCYFQRTARVGALKWFVDAAETGESILEVGKRVHDPQDGPMCGDAEENTCNITLLTRKPLEHSSQYRIHCALVSFGGEKAWMINQSGTQQVETGASLTGWSIECNTGFTMCGLVAGWLLVTIVWYSSGRSIFARLHSLPLLSCCAGALLGFVILAAALAAALEFHVEERWSMLFGRMTILLVVGFAVYLAWLHTEREMAVKEQISHALAVINDVNFPVVLLRSADLFAFGHIPSHEEARAKGVLVFLDTMEEALEFLGGSNPEDHFACARWSSSYCRGGEFAVFFSHQWTGFTKPDPYGVQYNVICECLRELSNREGRDENQVYAWVDYFSIPQANLRFQRMAIDSLPVYASLLQAFVIVAPDVSHHDTGILCDTTSYQQRGWCRAEQLCHRARRGTTHVFLADGRRLRPLEKAAGNARFSSVHSRNVDSPCSSDKRRSRTWTSTRRWTSRSLRRTIASTISSSGSLFGIGPVGQADNEDVEMAGWVAQALYVFADTSEFSCCRMKHCIKGLSIPCDREALVLPMLGLYAEIYRGREDDKFKLLYAWIQRGRDEIFPPCFAYRTERGVEHKTLFGDLIPRVERHVDAEAQAEMVRQGTVPLEHGSGVELMSLQRSMVP